jgi:heptosyltransferase-2
MNVSLPEDAHLAVIQTAFLGDVVFTSPLVQALKARWPRARLTFVSTPKAASLAECIPGVDRVLAFDKRGTDRGLRGLQRVALALETPDLALVPHASLRSALLALLSGARIRIGCRSVFTRFLYTATVPLKRGQPFVEQSLDLARVLEIKSDSCLVLAPPAAMTERVALALESRPSVGLVIGSEWETKRWPPRAWAALARKLLEAGLRPVLLGAPRERPIAAEVCAASSSSEMLDWTGNSIPESVAAIALMKAVVGGDTGLVHVARALRTPAVILFGPTNPGVHRFEPSTRVLRLGLDCQPCHPHGPRVCPLEHHRCMRELSVEQVFGAVEELRRREEAA